MTQEELLYYAYKLSIEGKGSLSEITIENNKLTFEFKGQHGISQILNDYTSHAPI